MNYDIRLKLAFDYDHPVAGGRHLVRVMPLTQPGAQRVIAASLAFSPSPAERSDGVDFYGNAMTALIYRKPHDHLEIAMTARVAVDRASAQPAFSPDLAGLRAEIAELLSVAPDSPHHFLGPSPLVGYEPEIAAYAGRSDGGGRSVAALALDLTRRIDGDFAYDPKATDVGTPPAEAFRLRRGVCQDFTHVMIAGLRGLGVPAGYVSGFLRTIPPPGKERLEGADAMHAWVRVWCGREAGWLEFDPTNAMPAGNDHIAVAYGRDYSDVAPIIGMLRSWGGQEGKQSVDVVPVA